MEGALGVGAEGEGTGGAAPGVDQLVLSEVGAENVAAEAGDGVGDGKAIGWGGGGGRGEVALRCFGRGFAVGEFAGSGEEAEGEGTAGKGAAAQGGGRGAGGHGWGKGGVGRRE